MRGDKRAQQTLLRLRSRFGDVLISTALDRLKAEAENKRGRGARKQWDDFSDRYFYMHVWAITELGFSLTEAKKLFSENVGSSFNQVEKAYLRGLKHFKGQTPSEKKQTLEEIYLGPKFKNYLSGLNGAATKR